MGHKLVLRMAHEVYLLSIMTVQCVYGNRTISYTVPRIHVFLTVHKLSYVDRSTYPCNDYTCMK